MRLSISSPVSGFFRTLSLALFFLCFVVGAVVADNSSGLLAPHPKKNALQKKDGDTKPNPPVKKTESEAKDAAKSAAEKDASKSTEVKNEAPDKKDSSVDGDTKKAEPKPAATKPETPKPEAPKPDTVELKKEPLRVTVKIPGQFESKKAEHVRLKGEDFANFELKRTVKHGTMVRKGDVLIEFDQKKYDEALAEKKRALRLSEISLKEEEISLKYLLLRHPLNKESFERSRKYDNEDLVYYFKVTQEWMKRMAGFRMKIAQFYVDNAKEELKQLEKMYAADDLVEETEEFILKRSKFMVEAEEFFYDMDKMSTDRSLKTMYPRMDVQMRSMAKLRELDYRKSKETYDFVLEQTQLRIEKSRETHKKLVEQYKKFTKDKQMMVLKAPADGLLFYGEYSGEFTPGKWNNAAAVASGMKVEQVVKNNQVLFTIIDPQPSLFRVTVPEKELHWINTGTQGLVTPTAFPDLRHKVKVTQRNSIPSANGDYVALLTVEIPEKSKIYPSMTGSVELVVYDKKEAITVPTTALKREDVEDDSWNHAYLYVFDGKTAVKKKVKTGQVKGDKTELLGGVAVGANVYKKFDDGEKAIEKAKADAEKAKKEKEEKAAKAKAEKEAKAKAEKAKKEEPAKEKPKQEKKKEVKKGEKPKEKKVKEKKEPKKD